MYKPNGYDSVEAKEFTGFNSPSAGAYVFGICDAEERTSKNGNPMLVLHLDIAEGEFKGNYSELSKRFSKDRLLKHYRVLSDENSGYVKGDVKAIEESNRGFKFNFDEKTLRGKLVGGMLQEEEYLANDGTVKTSLKVAYLCSVEKARSGSLKPMQPKKLDTSFSTPVSSNSELPWLN